MSLSRALLLRTALRNASLTSSVVQRRLLSSSTAASGIVVPSNDVIRGVGSQRLATTGIDQRNSLSRLVVSRLMGPDDSQMYGAVHGGTIMQVMEEAGTILSTQYCNRIGTSLDDGQKSEELVTVSGCVENIEFVNPMFIGDLAEVQAEIGYTSQHSVQVLVEVYAKNIMKAKRKLAARGKIWYVPMSRGKDKRVMEVPARTYTRGDPGIEKSGKVSYDRLKAIREAIKINKQDAVVEYDSSLIPAYEPQPGTVAAATASMNFTIHPSSCWAGERYVRGGLVMKWMDEVGSLCTTMHSKSFGYTANVDTIMFLRSAYVGNMMSLIAKPIFVGTKSMEVQISVDLITLVLGKRLTRQKAVDAIFTFITPDQDGKPRDLPPLKLVTDEEKKLFEERKKIYEQRKAAMMAAAAAAGKR